MILERSANAKRNIAFGFLNKIITLFLPFVIRTIMIRTLGVKYLGLNSLFTSILQVLNLSEMGFSSAIVYSMYKPVAENDLKTLCALLNLFKKIYRVVALIILSVGLVLLPFVPKLIHGSVPGDINVYLIYLIYLFNTVITYTLFAYKTAIPNAYQRVDVVSNIATITQGIMYAFQIIVLLFTPNYYVYLIIIPVSTLVNNIILSRYVDYKYPQIKGAGEINDDTKKDIRYKVAGLFVNKVCQTTRNSLDSICISAFLGLTATAMYNNYYYVISALVGVINIITTSFTAGVGNSVVLDSVEKNYRDMRKMNFLFMMISGWMTVCLLCLYQPFITIFFGKKYLFSIGVVIAFASYFYSLMIGTIRGLYSDACGLWWENRYRSIVESIANIVLNVVLVQFLGIYGIIIATMISLVVINFGFGSQIVFKYYFKNISISEYFIDHLKYFVVTLGISVVTYIICNRIVGRSIFVILVRLVICLVVPSVLYFLIYRQSKIYKISISWLADRIKILSKLKFLY